MSSPPDPVRVGLVGYGYSGRTFHAPLIAAVPGLNLCAVVSSNPARVIADLPHVVVYDNIEALMSGVAIDLVVIATPNNTHAPLARLALNAGKHVVVDKPFALDLTEARELVGLSETRSRLLSVFHNRRWDSDFLTVRHAIVDGRIGTVRHFESHFDRFRPQVRDRWRERDTPGGGLWFDLGPHLIDQTLQLFGLPERVQANLARQRQGAQSEDWAHVVLDYGPCRALLHASILAAGGGHRFVVHGQGGSLVKRCMDQQEQQLLAGMRPGDAGWGQDADALQVFDGNGGLRHVPATQGDQRQYYVNIAAVLNGAAALAVSPIQSLAVMAVLEAAAVSAATHQSVQLSWTPEERAGWV